MGAAAVLTVFAVGLVVGLVSGLIGIGGGVLIVPFLYLFYGHPEWFGVTIVAGLATVVAHATSLFVIVPTSLRGALVYHRAGLVEWRVVWPIGAASVVAAAVGARLAILLPPPLLKVGFGVLLIASGIQLFRRRPARGAEPVRRPLRLSLPVTLGIGAVVGLFSALLGVGGGIISIPLLLYVVGLDVRRVAATSIGIIAITAAAGTLAYMVTGLGATGLPQGSIGYVHVVTGAVMFAGSLLSVRWGAMLNQRLPPRRLAVLFAVVFLLIGIRLIVGNLALVGAIL